MTASSLLSHYAVDIDRLDIGDEIAIYKLLPNISNYDTL